MKSLLLTALHLFILLWLGMKRRRSLRDWLLWWLGLGLAHEAVWELASEAYVVSHEGQAYREAYRNWPNPFLPLFWLVMGGLGIGLSWQLIKANEC